MDDLENLEFLSLVSKITSEIHNHLGISDKTLAEFIIDQRSQCESLDQFKKKLELLDADFPNSLIGKSVVSVISLPEFTRTARPSKLLVKDLVVEDWVMNLVTFQRFQNHLKSESKATTGELFWRILETSQILPTWDFQKQKFRDPGRLLLGPVTET